MQGRRAQWGHVFPAPRGTERRVCAVWPRGTGLNRPDLVCTMEEQLQTVCPEHEVPPAAESPWGGSLASLLACAPPRSPAAQTHTAQRRRRRPGRAPLLLPRAALLGYST